MFLTECISLFMVSHGGAYLERTLYTDLVTDTIVVKFTDKCHSDRLPQVYTTVCSL